MDDLQLDSQEIAQETPVADVFQPPSIKSTPILNGWSYTHYSALPEVIQNETATECVLGVDEAGRGPVLGRLFRL
jgi:ribonuclease H2 subunit A